jgi:hemerythrin-like domain-containing protein
MDPFELLKADHRKVEQLFTELESASGKKKLDVFGQIRMELELHTQIEEKIFYPALEEPEDTHDLALEAYEEHAVVKDLLKQLGRAKTANDEWEAQAKVLQENVEHHVQEEENELFEKAESALGEEELEELGDRMAAEKEKKQRSASKSSKKSGASKSASKGASRSTAAKRTGGSKKSSKKSSKSSGSKGSRSKKSAKKR